MNFDPNTAPPCTEHPDWFDLETSNAALARQAIDLCATCPFLDACEELRLELAQDGNLAFSIYAGRMHAKRGVEVPIADIARVDRFGHRGRPPRITAAA